VAFESGATDLVAAEEHKGVGVYLTSLGTGRRTRSMSRPPDDRVRWVQGVSPSISADGRYVVFASPSPI
jgi:Tol biopolymer transport system component